MHGRRVRLNQPGRLEHRSEELHELGQLDEVDVVRYYWVALNCRALHIVRQSIETLNGEILL